MIYILQRWLLIPLYYNGGSTQLRLLGPGSSSAWSVIFHARIITCYSQVKCYNKGGWLWKELVWSPCVHSIHLWDQLPNALLAAEVTAHRTLQYYINSKYSMHSILLQWTIWFSGQNLSLEKRIKHCINCINQACLNFISSCIYRYSS